MNRQELTKDSTLNLKLSKKYNKVGDEMRANLINLVTKEKLILKEAAKRLDINYSTAKTIIRIYKVEKRSCKKTTLKKKIQNSNQLDKLSYRQFHSFDEEVNEKRLFEQMKKEIIDECKDQIKSEEEKNLNYLKQQVEDIKRFTNKLHDEMRDTTMFTNLLAFSFESFIKTFPKSNQYGC